LEHLEKCISEGKTVNKEDYSPRYTASKTEKSPLKSKKRPCLLPEKAIKGSKM